MVEWLEAHDGLAAWVSGIATSLALIWALWQARSDARAKADAAAVKIEALHGPINAVLGEFTMMLEHAFNAPPPDKFWRTNLRASRTLPEAIHLLATMRAFDMPSPALVRLQSKALSDLQHLSSVLSDDAYGDDIQELAEQLWSAIAYIHDDQDDVAIELRRHYAPTITALTVWAKSKLRKLFPLRATRWFGPERLGVYGDC